MSYNHTRTNVIHIYNAFSITYKQQCKYTIIGSESGRKRGRLLYLSETLQVLPQINHIIKIQCAYESNFVCNKIERNRYEIENLCASSNMY